jgi:peptidoglycan/LPS O-acetylase OafA/YrhL
MIWAAVVLASVGLGWLLGHGDASANFRAASMSAPEPLLVTLLGVTVGLYGRDRTRLRRAYSSPSLAHAGKLMFVAFLAPAATFVLAPVDWPAAWLYGFAAGCAGGAAAWIGNLPPRV